MRRRQEQINLRSKLREVHNPENPIIETKVVFSNFGTSNFGIVVTMLACRDPLNRFLPIPAVLGAITGRVETLLAGSVKRALPIGILALVVTDCPLGA